MTNVQPKRPLRLREKLLTQGSNQLSDVELLAIFISSGNGKKDCLQLANDLLYYLGDLRAVITADQHRFKQVPGLGPVRYAQLQAVLEICRRSDMINLQKSIQLTSSRDTHAFLKRQLRDKKNETFVALFLDNQNRLIAYEELFHGTINTTSVHARPIIERALALNAAALIIAHNHPSGISDASKEDILVTERLRHALQLIDTKLLDHLIIGDNEVFSIVSQMKWVCH